jgi:hypothetical protein
MIETDDDLLFPGDVAHLANRTTDAVRLAIRGGRLRAIRTARGTHLIRRSDAEGYARAAAERDAARLTCAQSLEATCPAEPQENLAQSRPIRRGQP